MLCFSTCLTVTDHTALLWSIETGKCLVKYAGHAGSGKNKSMLHVRIIYFVFDGFTVNAQSLGQS